MYRLSRLPWPLMLAALALALGIYGFLKVPGMDAYAAALNTAQLFVLNLPADQLPNWYVRAAGVLGPLSAVTAAILAFTEVIQHWFWRIEYRYRRPQYVFLGGGRAAAQQRPHVPQELLAPPRVGPVLPPPPPPMAAAAGAAPA